MSAHNPMQFIAKMCGEAKKADALSDAELAEELKLKVWSSLDMSSRESALLCAAIDRLSATPMTPDKTLEELVAAVVNAAFDCGEYDGDDSNYEPVLAKSQAAKKALFDHLQSATAAQQREVERVNGFREELRAKHHQLRDEFNELREQLRTERERSERWQSAFHEYGAHWPTCRDFNQCDCGFTALSHSGKEGV